MGIINHPDDFVRTAGRSFHDSVAGRVQRKLQLVLIEILIETGAMSLKGRIILKLRSQFTQQG
jgi:hypothetical protein